MSTQLFMPTFRVDECLEEIRECLEKGWTGLGFKTVQFEDRWKEYTGLENAHFLNSATVGLSLAFKILKMQNGWSDDAEVITTPLTFVSTNHAILYENLKPVFADVDEFLCLDPKDVESKITNKTKAILFVGIGGNAGRYLEIVDLCKKYDLALVLDAAHMAGTRINGKVPGNEADAVVYSFQAVKNLPTADSGMICFREKDNDELCRKLTWLGINKDTYARSNDKGAYKWKYDVEYVGYKYHGNSIMASIGLVQLKYLDQDNAYRKQLANWYDEGFRNQPNIRPVPMASNCDASRHLYVIEVDKRDELLLALNESEIYPGVHYRDNTEYKMYSYAKGSCPNSHRLSERILSLPMHLRMKKSDVDNVVEHIVKFTNM
ncbi:DegT/DnrJ/EryC1/StrS aminotransferase family protein [Paenibacillus sp. J22TS3]|uniref:DegT/DnrJ/EryC1/StrS family aminotransferase n=1 Tax=Paenibacillus sp. J22TS3 TaxID=2807192 RepID=UPI001B0817AE|nr:DegT/DnrJ/EryC1/StrS family aminotransferase [Paenibacillus sp. J22TS3]GIP21693.1 spore coat polysaccharide biosynthesis protein SpsC [Paenibacillus sp. J22TS3]